MKQFKTNKILIELDKYELLRIVGACNDAVQMYNEYRQKALAEKTSELAKQLYNIYKELPF